MDKPQHKKRQDKANNPDKQKDWPGIARLVVCLILGVFQFLAPGHEVISVPLDLATLLFLPSRSFE
jgi:hypothetical protein